MKHSEFSPSSRSKWWVCTSSWYHEKNYENHSSKHSLDGAATHTLLEKCIREGVDASTLIDSEIEVDGSRFVVDIERAEKVDYALAYINSKKGADTVITPEREVNPEYILSKLGVVSQAFGTVDVLIERPNEVEIVDLKDGFIPIYSFENPQLEQYAICIYSEYEAMGKPLEKVTLTIIQPRRCKVDSWSFDRKSLVKRANLFAKKIRGYAEEPIKAFAGDHCKWCRHKANCTEYAKYSLFAPFEKLGYMIEADCLSTVPDELIQIFLEKQTLFADFLKKLEEESKRRMLNGVEYSGFEIDKKKKFREWAHKDDVIMRMLEDAGVPKEKLMVKRVISPAQFEKFSTLPKYDKIEFVSRNTVRKDSDEYTIKRSSNVDAYEF